MSYKVILCGTPQHLQQALNIRMEVFHHEQGFPADTEIDENDPLSAHFLLIDEAQPDSGLGTLRWVPYPPSSVKLDHDVAEASSQEELPLGKPLSKEQLTQAFVSAGSAKLGRLALSSSLRGKKLGAKLVQDSEIWIREILKSNLKTGEKVEVGMKLHSQMQVVEFYKRLGYEASGEPFDEDGGPHLLCSKKVVVIGS